MRKWISLAAMTGCLISARVWAAEKQIVLRDYLDRQWNNELVSYPFAAAEGACDARSVTLIGPRGRLPVQLAEIEYWPGTDWVKSARLSFITDLTPLATDTYTVRYGSQPVAAGPGADLEVTRTGEQVQITTRQFGARLLLGAQTYPEPVPVAEVPGPVTGMRLADGAWFGGSAMYGTERIAGYAAVLTDTGPVFARVAIRYTYENGNTLDLAVRVAAGDNTMHLETLAPKDQPGDGFKLVISRELPQLIFQVQDELREDRECFAGANSSPKGHRQLNWAEIPLHDYVAPEGKPVGLVTQLSPWEDWFGTFTQTRIRLKLEHTDRELQIRSLDPGAWVEPRPIEELFSPNLNPDPAKGLWVGWGHKLLPIMRDPDGDIYLQVNAAQGVRKWTISDCLSMPGVAALYQHSNYKPEIAFPPETRPTVGTRLDEVKDFVLDWPRDTVRNPRLFITKSELQERWQSQEVDPEEFEALLRRGTVASAEQIRYIPDHGYESALAAYLLSGGSLEVAAQTHLPARLRQALNYDLWGMQFGVAGTQTAIVYDALIDSPVVPESDRAVLRAQMAHFVYRLTDPAVWSAERGYASGNQNMTVTWEISRGIAACAIADHPLAKTWYSKAERIMEYFLTHMVGPAGEWPEAMGQHGRTSINMLLAFAVASTNSGLRDYVNDPRMKRLILNWAKMLTPRDPRPRGHNAFAAPERRYFPAMGRDAIGSAGGTCGVMARMTRHTDPAYSAALQWAWLEEGGVERLNHLGAFAYVSCDRTLPSRTPAWSSEVFPYAGAMLRHGLGTPDEHQVLLYSGDHFAAFYTNHTGSFPGIFAYGTPVAGSFPGMYGYQDRYLTCHVDLAHEVGTPAERTAVYGYHGSNTRANPWGWPEGQTATFGEHGGWGNVSSFSTLPRQDYAAVDVARHYPQRMRQDWVTNLPDWPPVAENGEPPVDWRRQTLFLKDDDPAESNYLLIRDSITGGQPTMWQMWTVSEALDTPAKVKDVDAILALGPNHEILPARELQGNRFTAIGQLGVDVEYYIASPVDTPRHTLRWGTDMVDWANKLGQPEYQDLLHLQLPGDGAYYVAFFPRRRNSPAPTFSTLGDGKIIKVQGDFGADYGFLSALETSVSGEGVNFRGTAASVQDRNTGLVLSLGAEGTVIYQKFGVNSAFPVSLRIENEALTLDFPATLQPPAFAMAQPFPGGTLSLVAPGNWVLAEPQTGVELEKKAAVFELQVPSGCRTVKLVRR